MSTAMSGPGRMIMSGPLKGRMVHMTREEDRHIPRRSDCVERWIKAQRDHYAGGDENTEWKWQALDDLLDDYREHADTGTPLDAVVRQRHET